MSTDAVRVWRTAATAVIRRQLLTIIRYPANFWAALATPFLSLAGALLLARTFTGDPFGAATGGAAGVIDLSAYLTLSAVFWTFVEGQLIMGFGLLTEMERGTLEALFLTPAPRSAYLAGMTAFSVLRTLANVAATLILASLTFGPVSVHRPLPAAALTVLNLAVVYGYGLILAGLILLLRSGTFTYVWSTLLPLLTGRWFSPAVLPLPLRWLAQLLPLTHGLDALRWAVASGTTMFPLWVELTYVAVSAGVLPLAGLALFLALERKARARGSLGQY